MRVRGSAGIPTLLTFFLLCHGSAPGGFRTTHYSVESGLSQSTVRGICRDRQGFIWIATGDGLNRFDGYTFQQFHHQPGDSASLPDDDVWAVETDFAGTLWVGTTGGLASYNPATRRFTPAGSRTSTPQDRVRRILRDRTGVFWLATGTGLAWFDPRRRLLLPPPGDVALPPELRDSLAIPLLTGPDGTVWVAADDRLFTYSPPARRWTPVPLPEESPREKPIFAAALGKKGTLWIAIIRGGLVEYDLSARKATTHFYHPSEAAGPFDNWVRSIAFDGNGNVWASTASRGVHVRMRGETEFRPLVLPAATTAAARFESGGPLLMDEAGILWAGFDGAGLLKVNTRESPFRRVVPRPLPGRGTGAGFVKPLLEARDGRILAGTFDHGLAAVDLATGSTAWYTHDPDNSASISSNGVVSLAEDSSGTLWVGTLRGLNRMRPDGRLFRRFLPSPLTGAGTNDAIVTALLFARSGLWVGTRGGLWKLEHTGAGDPNLQRVRPPLGGLAIECITEDAQGRLRVGTRERGLVLFDPADGSAVTHAHDPSNPNSLSHNTVKTVLAEGDSVLWIGTEGGLNRWLRATNIWRRYGTSDGLPNDFIYGILPDGRGGLWISTNRGLSHMLPGPPDTPRFRNYTPEDGLQSFEFNTQSYARMRDGRLLFGGVNGFNIFHPDSVRDNPVAPRVAFTELKKFDQPVDPGGDPNAMEEIVLEPGESVFSLSFAALEFTAPERNRYAYRMEGVDRDWVQAGTRREARYTNLDPGTYLFRAKACNSDGVWNEKGAALRVTVLPPFWRTPWFMTLAAVAGMAAVGGTARYAATRKLKEQVRRLENERAVQAERERISRDLHDNVGAQLVNIISGLELAEGHASRGREETRDVLRSLQEDARESIDQLRETIWAMKAPAMQVKDLASHLESYVRRRFQYEEGLALDCSADIAAERVLAPAQTLTIFRIVQEATTNVLKHAGASRATFRIATDAQGALSVVVADNGIGAAESTGGGHGMENMRQRAAEAGGTVSVSRAPGGGTEARFLLPPSPPAGTGPA
jgi:signal transduction histidine kinase/ligand-binding sensor domain-containing protein